MVETSSVIGFLLGAMACSFDALLFVLPSAFVCWSLRQKVAFSHSCGFKSLEEKKKKPRIVHCFNSFLVEHLERKRSWLCVHLLELGSRVNICSYMLEKQKGTSTCFVCSDEQEDVRTPRVQRAALAVWQYPGWKRCYLRSPNLWFSFCKAYRLAREFR